MALQVWLPLDGNLDNKGLTPISITNNTGTSTANGKTGSCYSYSGDSSSYTTYSGFSADGLKELSVCCWACPTNANVNDLFGMNYMSGTNNYYQFSVYNNNNLYVRDSNTGRTGTAKQFYIADSNNPIIAGEWVHLCFTYKNGNVAIYRNGNLVDSGVTQEGSYLNSSITGYIFGGSNINSSSSRRFNGKICDFRIYDHALSPKEVKDISRGLIVHYPLCTRESVLSKYSSVNWNQLAENGNFANSYTSWTLRSTANQSASVTNGVVTLTKVNTNLSMGAILFSDTVVIDSSNVNHLFYIKGDTKATNTYFAVIGFSSSAGAVSNNTQLYNYNNEWKTMSAVVSPYATGNKFMLRAGSSSDAAGSYGNFRNIMCIDLTQMFGAGNEPSKKECDLIFIDNYYSYDTGTTKSLVSPIYDKSGYGRNASISSSYFSLSDDTTRYDYSTVCNGSSCMQIVSPTTEARSASLWLKFPTTVQEKFIAFVDNKSRLGFGKGATGLICSTVSYTKQFPTAALTAGSWHHVVVTNEGASPSNVTRKLYIDGVEQTPTTTDNYWGMNSQDILQVGARTYNIANYPGLNGLISDFRLYAAALTDKDVLDLYENSATVDNFGNLHCYEAKETAENLFTFENLQEEASGTISITTANGEKAVVLPGNSFGGSIHHYFDEKFQPNTQYKFDIFIDGYGASHIMGMQIRYTDGTYSGSELYDRQYTTQGYKHKVFYSNASKSIDYFTLVNPNSGSAYYRTDSVIIPMDNPTNVENKGIVNTGYFREDTTEVSIGKGDNFDVNNLIEK